MDNKYNYPLIVCRVALILQVCYITQNTSYAKYYDTQHP